MPTTEERSRVLQMVSEGKITAEEGARLLEAMRAADRSSQRNATSTDVTPQWLRARVTDLHSGSVKKELNIPLHIVQVGIKLGLRLVGNVSPAGEYEEVLSALQEGQAGKVLEADDEESGQRVELFVE
ncbi:MAG: hypothetical protein GXP38_16695 [Chloroflexi bacterium]|nr:hypothetical protein [Chloroflexota bacterium]